MLKISLTFDDGRIDVFEAFKILKKFALEATFYVTTGFIDRTFQTECFGHCREPLTLKQLSIMQNSGMEIASHGDKHITDVDDFLVSYQKLNDWGLIKSKKIGFSVPNSLFELKDLMNFYKALDDKLLYIRIGRNYKCYSFLNKVRFVITNGLFRLFHISFKGVYNRFNKCNLNVGADKIFNSIVIYNYTSIDNLISFIKKNICLNAHIILMFHSIVDKPKDKWEWSTSNFTKLCEFLSKLNSSKVASVLPLGKVVSNEN